jgi:hypothetical protein
MSTNSTVPMVLGQVERGLSFRSERRFLRTKKGAEPWSASSSRHRVNPRRCSIAAEEEKETESWGLGSGLVLRVRKCVWVR